MTDERNTGRRWDEDRERCAMRLYTLSVTRVKNGLSPLATGPTPLSTIISWEELPQRDKDAWRTTAEKVIGPECRPLARDAQPPPDRRRQGLDAGELKEAFAQDHGDGAWRRLCKTIGLPSSCTYGDIERRWKQQLEAWLDAPRMEAETMAEHPEHVAQPRAVPTELGPDQLDAEPIAWIDLRITYAKPPPGFFVSRVEIEVVGTSIEVDEGHRRNSMSVWGSDPATGERIGLGLHCAVVHAAEHVLTPWTDEAERRQQQHAREVYRRLMEGRDG